MSLWSGLDNWRSPKCICMDRILAGDMEMKDSCKRNTHSAAVKIWLELVQIAFIGLSCPFISPMGAKVSTFQSLRVPPLQPLSRTGVPGTSPRAHTQSLWALGTCWKRRQRSFIWLLDEKFQVLWLIHFMTLAIVESCGFCFTVRRILTSMRLLLYHNFLSLCEIILKNKKKIQYAQLTWHSIILSFCSICSNAYLNAYLTRGFSMFHVCL